MIFQMPGEKIIKKKTGQASCPRIEHVGKWHSFLGKIVAQRSGFSDSTKKSGG